MLPNGVDLIATLFGVWRAGRSTCRSTPASPTTRSRTSWRRPARPRSCRADGLSRPVRRADAPRTVRCRRRGARPVHVGHDRAAQAGPADPHGVRHLLDGVIGKLRGGAAPAGDGDAPPPMPNLIPVSLSLWAGIYNVLFALRVGAGRGHGRVRPGRVGDAGAAFGIRSTVLPPAAMVALVDDERVTDLAPLRFVRSITAPLSPLQARRFRDRFGIAVLNSYGQTEIGGEIVGWSAADSRAHGDDKLGSVGRPHAGVEVRVDGRRRRRARVRRAVGPHAGAERGLRRRTATSPTGSRADGWFRTGDVGRVDADGFVWIEGRVSDMINRGGLKVFPAEVEEVLRRRPTSPTSRWSAGPTTGWARCRWRSWCRRPVLPRHLTVCRVCAVSTSPPTRCRCGSRSSTPCPATRWARC